MASSGPSRLQGNLLGRFRGGVGLERGPAYPTQHFQHFQHGNPLSDHRCSFLWMSVSPENKPRLSIFMLQVRQGNVRGNSGVAILLRLGGNFHAKKWQLWMRIRTFPVIGAINPGFADPIGPGPKGRSKMA